MPVAFTDEFVSKVLQPVLIGLFILLAVPITLIGIVLLQTWLFSQPEAAYTLKIIGIFQWFHGTPETVAGPFMQLVPALVAAICLKANKTALTRTGRIVFIIVIYIIVVSFITVFLLNPNSSEQSDNISGGAPTLERFISAAQYSMNTALIYFGLLAGLSVGVNTEGG